MAKAGRSYLAVLFVLCGLTAAAATEPRLGTPVTAVEPSLAAQWGAWIDGQLAGGTWRLVVEQRDADFPGRYHRRYEQLVGGATVFGSGLARQVGPSGATETVFGYTYENLTLDTTPSLTVEEARSAVVEAMGAGSRAVGEVRLTILPLDTGAYLTYMLWGKRLDPPSLMRYFIDARTGAVVSAYEDLKTETAIVGVGSGVWNDRKKLGANHTGSTYLLEDLLRPARATTYDMRFDVMAWNYQSLAGFESSDADADWSDGAAVDAHAYAGATYDYYYDRHGRHGIDDHDMPVRSFVHVLAYYINAFWSDDISAMTYGDGGFDGGALYKPLSCALDVVAHEMTHGVTSRTWDGIYYGESGALNEALSDVMGLGVEFYVEPVGNGRKQADYWMAEDLSDPFDPVRFAFRSAANPSLFCHGFACDPDHYSRRYLGPIDNAGVHINSGIANHAFYLLIEGGTNRTSGITVTGLGAANRDKAEKIFYRGFTKFLTPSSRFTDARAATIRAATELYGAGSIEATRTGQAWTAVGVE